MSIYSTAGYRNALLYSAGLGLYHRYKANQPMRVTPVSKIADQQQQIIQLRRLVARNTPQVSNWNYYTALVTAASVGVQSFSINTTALFTASADFDAQVIGDRFLNHSLYFSANFPTDVERARVIIYWCRKAENVSSVNTFVESLDPAAHIVVYDRCFFPKVGASVFRTKINLKKVMTVYNKSSDVLEKGDLRIRVLIENPTAAQRSIPTSQRLFLSNK